MFLAVSRTGDIAVYKSSCPDGIRNLVLSWKGYKIALSLLTLKSEMGASTEPFIEIGGACSKERLASSIPVSSLLSWLTLQIH